MVEAVDLTSKTLASLKEKSKDADADFEVGPFLNVIEVVSKIVKDPRLPQVYDVLEQISNKNKNWAKIQQNFRTFLKGKADDPNAKILINQLETLDTQALSQVGVNNTLEIFEDDNDLDYSNLKKETVYENTQTYVENKDILDCIRDFHVDQERDICAIILGPETYNSEHKLGIPTLLLTTFAKSTDFPQIVTKNKFSDKCLVYYPLLRLFKNAEGTPYKRPYKIKAIQVKSRRNFTAPEIEKLMKHYFARAIEKNIKILILTAIGCGRMGNDPKEVAKAIRNLLTTEMFKGAFEKVIFSIKVHDDDKNFKGFAAVFGTIDNKYSI